jgi:hypothetical protein
MANNVIILNGHQESMNAKGSVLAESMMDGYYGIEKELIQLDIPEETTHYKPISYKRLIDETMEMLDKNNLQVLSRRYETNRDRQAVIAYYNVQGPDAPFGYQLAWRNSYNKAMSVAFTTGVHVWICGNGLVSGEQVFTKKHVGSVSIDLRDEMQKQIDQMGNTYDQMISEMEVLQQRPLTQREMAELAGRLFIEKEVITPTQMSTLKKQILEPSFDYSYDDYSFENQDMYSLYQHGTYALKSSSPYNNVQNLAGWHEALLEMSKS